MMMWDELLLAGDRRRRSPGIARGRCRHDISHRPTLVLVEQVDLSLKHFALTLQLVLLSFQFRLQRHQSPSSSSSP